MAKKEDSGNNKLEIILTTDNHLTLNFNGVNGNQILVTLVEFLKKIKKRSLFSDEQFYDIVVACLEVAINKQNK